MTEFTYDFDNAKSKLTEKTRQLAAIIEAANLIPDQRAEFWTLIAARNMISYEIETSRARIAIEELMKAQPNNIPWQAAEYLKFEPTFVNRS